MKGRVRVNFSFEHGGHQLFKAPLPLHCFGNVISSNFGAKSRENSTLDYVRFEVFTAVTMKNAVFWDVPPCGSCKNRRFGRT
jgi:hypothetical protein